MPPERAEQVAHSTIEELHRQAPEALANPDLWVSTVASKVAASELRNLATPEGSSPPADWLDSVEYLEAIDRQVGLQLMADELVRIAHGSLNPGELRGFYALANSEGLIRDAIEYLLEVDPTLTRAMIRERMAEAAERLRATVRQLNEQEDSTTGGSGDGE